MTAPIDILMPKLGLTMTEGIVAEWNVEAGASVRAGDTIFSVETEKVVNEVEAEHDGVIETLLVPVGTAVPVGSPVARFIIGSGAAAPASVSKAKAEPAAAAPAPQAAIVTVAKSAPPAPQRAPGARIIATPLARRMASEKGVDLSAVTGTGPNGRIKAVDVETAPSAGASSFAGGASNNAAPVYFLDVDVTRILALKTELGDIDIPLCAFVVVALARALREPSDAVIAVSRRANSARMTSRIANAATMKLSGIARAILAGDEGEGQGQQIAAISVFDLGIPALRFSAPRLQAGQLVAVSIGAVTAQKLGLSMAFDAAIDPFDAADMIERIVRSLEQPMGLLV